MKGFEQLWASVAKARDGEQVSPELKPLLHGVYDDVLTKGSDFSLLRRQRRKVPQSHLGHQA